jgi:hypothetical protein
MAKSTATGPSDQPYAVRLRPEEVARIERIQARVEAKARSGSDVTLAALGRTSRASVLRLAVLRGIAALEAEIGAEGDATP